MGVIRIIKNYPRVFNTQMDKEYTEEEGLRLIASAISQGSELQKDISLIRDTYQAVWRLVDFGFRKTSIEIAEKLVPQAVWHQKYSIAQDMCEELETYYSIFGNFELMNKYAALYKRYKDIRDYEYEAKKMYNEVVYRHKRGLPVETDKVISFLLELKNKLPKDNLCYHYIFFECKSLICEGAQLENLYLEAIDYFESLYFNHSTYISVFIKHLIEFYTSNNQLIKAKSIIASKVNKYETGSTPWFRFMKVYANFLANQNDDLVIDITNEVTSHPKYSELPEDNKIEWSVIIEKSESIAKNKIVNDDVRRIKD